MTTILLVRHGESAANRDDMFAGNYDAELLPNGFEQAKMSAEYIKSNYAVDKVYSSDLKRAFETGKCIAAAFGLTPETRRNLREIDAGAWDGVKFSQIIKDYPEEFNLWFSDIAHSGCPGGETIAQVGERVFSEVSRIAEENEGKTVVIASHATPVRVAYTLAKYGTLDKIGENSWPSNASVSVLYYDNGKWSCGEYSIDEHMKELRTYLPENI